MDHLYDSFEDIRPVPLDISHEFLDFLVFRFVDNELVGLFHVVVEVLSKFCMS